LQALVLLKNEGSLLPLALDDLKIAIIGSAAQDAPITGGGGSGAVTPYAQSTIYEVSVLTVAVLGTPMGASRL
jgi:beta-glucosidase-like glycosyl hydrolase